MKTTVLVIKNKLHLISKGWLTYMLAAWNSLQLDVGSSK
jgi:hypothetical protein